MNHYHPTGVPCLICHQRIDHWDADDRAQPCGHSHEDAMIEAMAAMLTAPRVHLHWPKQHGRTRLAAPIGDRFVADMGGRPIAESQ